MSNLRVSYGFRRPTPIVLATLIILVVAYVAMALGFRFSKAAEAIYLALHLDPSVVLSGERPWTLLTYTLLHDLGSPMHLLLNCLVFYFFGPDLEESWGRRRFLVFMGLAALGGGLFILATALLHLGFAPVVGASSITMGAVVAWGISHPDRQVLLFFLPVRGIWLVWMSVAFELLNALSFSPVSAAGHFGGMAVGAAFVLVQRGALRRYWLKLKLRKLQAENEAIRRARQRRAAGPSLRVIEGGAEQPKDKRYLN